MPLHHFIPPPHIVGLVLSSALALAAAAYIARGRVPAGLARAGSKLKDGIRSWRSSRNQHQGLTSYSRGTSEPAWNSTGNTAFDEYRSATLTKLEQEAAEFRRYLDELRHAKDKSEFDAFLNDRREKSTTETLTP